MYGRFEDHGSLPDRGGNDRQGMAPEPLARPRGARLNSGVNDDGYESHFLCAVARNEQPDPDECGRDLLALRDAHRSRVEVIPGACVYDVVLHDVLLSLSFIAA